MFAKVIPAMKLPRTLGAFDYAIPDKYRDFVRRGSWVVVPWRGRTADGLVIGVNDSPEIEGMAIKEILGLGSAAVLSDDLVRLPEWMAERYFTAPGTALNAFLPRTPKTMVMTELDSATERQRDRATVEARKIVLRYSTPTEKTEELIRLVRETADAGSGVVVVTPHAGEVEGIASLLEKEAGGAPVIRFHGRTSEAKLRRVWKEIMTLGKVIVVGNRPTVFAPVNDPALFLILEADSADLRQYDQNPRYDAREIALRRAEWSGADMVFMSHAPRLEEFALTLGGGFEFIEIGTGQNAGRRSKTGQSLTAVRLGQNDSILPRFAPICPVLLRERVSLVDISGNPLGRDNPLSPVAAGRVRDALQRGKKVLIFLNRRGAAGALVCADCGKVFRCPRCGIAESFTGEGLICRRCEGRRAVPASCGVCGGHSTRPVGMGTASVAEALGREFPEAGLYRHDSESAPSDGSGSLPADADIYVGTRLLLHDAAETDARTDWGCVVSADTDALLAHPGFRVMENAWRTVRLMRDIAASSGAELLLQTVDPENPKIRRLLADTGAFLEAENADRSKSGYPPSGNLLTVTSRDDDESGAERAAQKFRMDAERALQGSGALVAGPLKPEQPFRDGRWRRVVAIKTPATVPDAVNGLLRSLPEEHIIDRNPENI